MPRARGPTDRGHSRDLRERTRTKVVQKRQSSCFQPLAGPRPPEAARVQDAHEGGDEDASKASHSAQDVRCNSILGRGPVKLDRDCNSSTSILRAKGCRELNLTGEERGAETHELFGREGERERETKRERERESQLPSRKNEHGQSVPVPLWPFPPVLFEIPDCFQAPGNGGARQALLRNTKAGGAVPRNKKTF